MTKMSPAPPSNVLPFTVHTPRPSRMNWISSLGMPVRTWSRTRLSMKQRDRNTGVALFSSDKLMRTADKRQVLLSHMMHVHCPLLGLDDCGLGQASGIQRVIDRPMPSLKN